MAFEKKFNDCRILFLVLIGIPLIASTNIDCGGKSFHCVNSTHFMICVDLGGGVSTTVDDLVISCPPSTLCQGTNRFECEFPVKTTPMPQTQVTEITNEIITTPQWEEIVVTTTKNASKELDLKYIDGTNLTTVADSTTDVSLQNTSSLNANDTRTENNVATTDSTYESTVYTEANNVNVTIANANETINNIDNQTDTYIVGTDVVSGLIAIVTKTTAVPEITDNPISATNLTDADNNINSTDNFVTLNTVIETTTMANKPSLLNNNSSDNVNTTNLIEDIYFTTSIPDLVTATTMEEKLTQAEMLTPSIIDAVETSTDTITTVSEYSTGLFNISERVDNKTGTMNESGMEKIVTTTSATLIFTTTSNLINETAINTGSVAVETNNTTIVSENTPGIRYVTDPPTTEIIIINTEKYINSNNNIPEITTDTIATNIDSTRDLLYSGIVTTTDISYTEREMAAVGNTILNGSAIAAGDSSLTTMKTNKEIVTANPIIEVFISSTTEISTNSDLPRSEIESFVSTTIPSDIKINKSSTTSNPQIINLNETTVTTENIITQTGKTIIQQAVTNLGNESMIEKNLTGSKNISEAQSTSQVTLMWNSTDVTNSTGKETAITSFLSNNQSITEAPVINITDFQVTPSIDIKQNQPINQDFEKTQNEIQKNENVQSSLTNSEIHKASWSASTIVESSTTATTMTNDIYLHEPENKQIDEITTTINANVNILEFLSTANPTDVVSRTTATAKEIEYTQDSNVGIPNLVVNNASNTSPKLEDSVNETTKVNMDSILQPADNNEANNLIQTISTKILSEENPTSTSRSFVTMTELNQGHTSTIVSLASPQNNLETVSTTLPSPTLVLSISSESNIRNETGIEMTSNITPLNTISTEIDKIGTVTNVKTESKVENPLQNVLMNIDFSTEIPPARDVPFQTQNIFTATNNAFGKTTESYVGDNQNVTTQDTIILLTIASDGLASYSSTTNALDDPKQIVQGVTTEPFEGIRKPVVKEDVIVMPVTQEPFDGIRNPAVKDDVIVMPVTQEPFDGIRNPVVKQDGIVMPVTQEPIDGIRNPAVKEDGIIMPVTRETFDGIRNPAVKEDVIVMPVTQEPFDGIRNPAVKDDVIVMPVTQEPFDGIRNPVVKQDGIVMPVTQEPIDGIRNPAVKEDGIIMPVTRETFDGIRNPAVKEDVIVIPVTQEPFDGIRNPVVKEDGIIMPVTQETFDGIRNPIVKEDVIVMPVTQEPFDGIRNPLVKEDVIVIPVTQEPFDGIRNPVVKEDGIIMPVTQEPFDGIRNPVVKEDGIVMPVTQEPFDGIRNPVVKEDGIVMPVTQTENASTSDQQNTFINTQAQIGSPTTNDLLGGLEKGQAQTSSSPGNGQQDSLVNSEAQAGTLLTTDQLNSVMDSEAQTGSSTTNVPQGSSGNSQATTGSSLANGPQGGLVNSLATTASSLANGPQGGLEYSQAQTERPSTIGLQGGLVNSHAATGSSPTDGAQGGLVNSQAPTGSSLVNGPQNDSVNGQVQIGSSLTSGPQVGLINSQATTRSSLANGPQAGLVNSQATTDSSLANGPQGGLGYSQAQTERPSTIGLQGGLGYSHAATGSSPTDGAQGGLVNSQATTGNSLANGSQGGLVNSHTTTESSLANGPQGGLGYSQAQTERSSTIGLEGSLVNSQAATGSSPTDGAQGGLVNSQTTTGSSFMNGPQGDFVNGQVQTGSSLTSGPQVGLINSQATTGSSFANGPQGGFVNGQTGSSFTNGPHGGLVNSQAKTESSIANGTQDGIVNSETQIKSSATTNHGHDQGGLINSLVQSSWATDQPHSLVDSQTHTGTSFTTDQLHSLVNSEVQIGSSSTNGPQTGILVSQGQKISTATNDQQKEFVNSQIQTGLSLKTEQTHRFSDSKVQTETSVTAGPLNSQVQPASLITNGQQNELVNSQTQTANPQMNGQQNDVVNNQVQVGSTTINISEKGLVNSQAQTASSTRNGPNGLVNSQVQAAATTANNQQTGVVNSQVLATSSTTTGQQNSLVNSQAQMTSSTANDQQNGAVNSQVLASTVASEDKNNETLYLKAKTETKLPEQSHLENTSSINSAVIQPVTAMPLFEDKRQIASNANDDDVTVSSIDVSTIKLLLTGGINNKAPLKTTNLPLAYNKYEIAGEFRTPYATTTVMESSLRENPIIYTTAGGLSNANKHLSSQSIKPPTENYEPVTGKNFPAYQGGNQYGGKVEKSTQGGLNNANEQVETTTESMKSTVEENAKRFSISIAITPPSQVPTPGGNSTIKSNGNRTQTTPINLETTGISTQTTGNGDVDKFNKTPEVMQTSATGVVTKGNSGVSHVEATKKPLTVHTVTNTDQKMPQDSLTNLPAVDNINQENKVQPNIIPDLIQQVTDSQNAGQLSHATSSLSIENTTKGLVTLQTEVTTSRSIAKTSVNKNDLIVTQQTTRYLTTSTVKPTSSKPQAQSSSVKPALNSDTVTNSNQKGAEKKSNFICKDRIRGRYSDPDDCRKFYICSGLPEPIIGLCPVKTVFSEIKTQCTKNLSHCIRNNQFKCVSKGRFSDYLQQNVYYICVQNTMHHFIRFKFQCQMGYYLNKTTVRCLKIPEVVNLSSSFDNVSKSTVETISNEDKKSNEKTKSKKEDDFECEKQGKFADENNCRRYYVCSKSKKSEEFRRRIKKCDSDEVFHKDKKKCVDAESYEC